METSKIMWSQTSIFHEIKIFQAIEHTWWSCRWWGMNLTGRRSPVGTWGAGWRRWRAVSWGSSRPWWRTGDPEGPQGDQVPRYPGSPFGRGQGEAASGWSRGQAGVSQGMVTITTLLQVCFFTIFLVKNEKLNKMNKVWCSYLGEPGRDIVVVGGYFGVCPGQGLGLEGWRPH